MHTAIHLPDGTVLGIRTAPETLEKLAFRNVPVYRNDLQGAVGIEIRKGKPKKVRTMIKE